MKTELVRFKTSDGLTLEGLLFMPNNKTNKVVVHVHGSAGNFYENVFIDTFSKRYTDEGYAFLTFNNRGAEYQREMLKSVNNKKENVIQGMLHEIFEESIFDINAAIDFCKEKSFKNVIIEGHSLGCNKVIWYTINKKFKGKIILLAPCDLVREANSEQKQLWEKAKELIKQNRGLGTVPNFWGKWNISALTLISVWSDNVNADMFRYRDKQIVKILSKIKNNILIEIGTKDQFIPTNKQESINYLQKAFLNAKVDYNLIDGANHHYENKENEVMDNIICWLNKI